MSNYFDTPTVDLLDYGDHTGCDQLHTEAGIELIIDVYESPIEWPE